VAQTHEELTIREEDGSVSIKSQASKSSSSTESGKFRSPEKNKQRPDKDETNKKDHIADDLRPDNDNLEIITTEDKAIKDGAPKDARTQHFLDNITIDLERQYHKKKLNINFTCCRFARYGAVDPHD
jgi:hypothetical protein